MAGEVKGKVYEAIVKIALEMAVSKSTPKSKVFWHEQPSWISIEADLAVGRSIDSIDHLFLVTHSINEKSTEKKFWRNVGELFQWKVHGRFPVAVHDITFDSHFKPKLIQIFGQIANTLVDISDRPYGSNLIAYVSANLEALGKSDDQREERLRLSIDPKAVDFDKKLADSVNGLAKDLQKVLSLAADKNAALWRLMRTLDHRDAKPRQAKATYVRRGLGKLAMMPVEVRRDLYTALLGGAALDSVPAYLIEIGLFSEGIAGSELADQDVRKVVELLGPEGCEGSLGYVNFGAMENYLQVLRALPDFELYLNWLGDNHSELSTQRGMLKALLQCHADPDSLVKGAKSPAPQNVWLYLYLASIFKAKAGKILGFGYSNIGVGDEGDGISRGYVILADWLNRKAGVELPVQVLRQLSKVLSSELSRIKSREISGLARDTRQMLIQRCMYVISTYRSFDPLRDLIERAAERSGLKVRRVKVPSVLQELASVSAATSEFFQLGDDLLVYWQSCHDSHVNDKSKELSGRFRATKIAYAGGNFVERKQAKRIAFVADGEWRTEDFELFLRSGVEKIFFPDEMEDLMEFAAACSESTKRTPSKV